MSQEDTAQSALFDPRDAVEPACDSKGGHFSGEHAREWRLKDWAIVSRMRLDYCRRCWDEQPDLESGDEVLIRDGSAKKTYHKVAPAWRGDGE